VQAFCSEKCTPTINKSYLEKNPQYRDQLYQRFLNAKQYSRITESAGFSEKQAARAQALAELVRQGTARPGSKLPSSLLEDPQFLESPAYNGLFASCGAPAGWPVPRPVMMKESRRRYYSTEASSATTSVNVPAGQAALVFMTPYQSLSAGTIVVSETASTQIDWPLQIRRDALINDWNTTDGGADDNLTFAQWATHTPHSLVGSGVHSGPVADYKDSHMVQFMGGHTDIQLAVPFDGTCASWCCTEGDSPASVGRLQQTIDLPGDGESRPDGIHGSLNLPRGDREANSSLRNLCMTNGKARLHQGSTPSASSHVTLIAAPSEGWFKAGEMLEMDAPTTSVTSVTRGFFPRRNPLAANGFGLFLLSNTGSVSVTMNVTFHCAFNSVFSDEDSISQLAQQMRAAAPQLIPHAAPSSMGHVVPAAQVGSSAGPHPLQEVGKQVKSIVGSAAGAVTALGAKTMAPKVAQNASNGQKLVAGIKAIGSGAMNAFRWLTGKAENAAETAIRYEKKNVGKQLKWVAREGTSAISLL